MTPEPNAHPQLTPPRKPLNTCHRCHIALTADASAPIRVTITRDDTPSTRAYLSRCETLCAPCLHVLVTRTQRTIDTYPITWTSPGL